MGYRFVYRCRYCNVLFDLGDNHQIDSRGGALRELNRARKGESQIAPLMTMHFCSETSGGLGDLVGFRGVGFDFKLRETDGAVE